MKTILSFLILCAVTNAGFAAEMNECKDWRSSAHAIAEPWEENTRTFSNGKVRVAIMDTIEPALGAFHVLVLSPPYDEVGSNQCKLISAGNGIGFSGIDMKDMKSGYDPSTGLALEFPVQRYNGETDEMDKVLLTVSINQKTGQITVGYDLY